MIPKTEDGHVFFAIPWHNCVVLGTTDTPVKTRTLEPIALEEERAFFWSMQGNTCLRITVEQMFYLYLLDCDPWLERVGRKQPHSSLAITPY